MFWNVQKSDQDFDPGPMRPESIPLYKLAFTIYLDDLFGREKPFLCENYDNLMW